MGSNKTNKRKTELGYKTNVRKLEKNRYYDLFKTIFSKSKVITLAIPFFLLNLLTKLIFL